MPGGVAPSKCFATIVCSSATSSIVSGCLWTRCTLKRSCSSTHSPRSSRPRSTPSSDSRHTIPTVIRFPIASFASCPPTIAPCSIWSPARRASVSRVPDGDSDLLRYLGELGLVPGSDLELVAYAPFGGPVTVRTTRGEHAISRELADRIAAA